MSKKRNLNKHKGPVKMSGKKFNDKRFEIAECPKLVQGGKAYIAFDSCAVINMAKAECHMLDTAFHNRREKALHENLEELRKRSAIKNGFVCDRGQYVMCIVPAVLEEVDMHGKQFSERIQKDLQKQYLVLRVSPEYQQQFDALTGKIMQEFKKNGFFVNGWGEFMEHDAKITAQAAIFNLSIASQDEHLNSALNGHRQHIQFLCARYLPGDHNGHQAVPMTLREIMTMIRNNERLPELENSLILTDETRKQLERLGYCPNEYVRPNPTLIALQTPVQVQAPVSVEIQTKKSNIHYSPIPSLALARNHE